MNTGGITFPNPHQAPNDGPLAMGGDLSVQTLLSAYTAGIFPWYSIGSPILWWCPNPRFVLRPESLIVSRSLQRILREPDWKVTFDHDFGTVIRACSHRARPGQDGTWITSEMVHAYEALHQAGYAHSIEVWKAGTLAGGLYGIAIGQAFFGESMFYHHPNASKVGFVHLVQTLISWGFGLIDCQQKTAHLARFGATEWDRDRFLDALKLAVSIKRPSGKWDKLYTSFK